MHFIDQIDGFILGKLSSIEEEEFRRQLLIDSSLAQEVTKRELILSGLEALGNQEMKDRIKWVRKKMLEEEKNPPQKKGRNRSLLLWISTAAAIFIFCLIGWQFLNPSEANPSEIFAESYQPYINNFGSRGTDATKDYLPAGAYYDSKNYTAAIPLFQNILKIEPKNSEVELILGDCLLSINKTEEAIFHFNAVLKRQTNLYNDPAQWFLALSYLKQNEIEKCENTLLDLTQDTRADYHQEAKDLYSRLSDL